MDGLSLLAEARANGLKVRADGDRLVIRGPRQAEPIAKRLLERKREVIEALRVSISGELVARVRAAWPWLAEHRPDLYRRICDADYADDAERLREAMEEASRAYEQRQRGECVRIFSRVLGVECWIVETDADAGRLETELKAKGDARVVLTADEAMILGKMAENDARELFAALGTVQRVMPGSRLRSVERSGADA